MTTYSSRTKTTSRRKRNVAIIVISLIVLFFVASFFTSASMAVLRLPIIGVQKIASGIGSVMNGFVSARIHAEENRVLLARIERLEADASRLKGIEDQYADMLASFGRTDYASSTIAGGAYTVASVMIRPPHVPFDVFGIDAGEREGVQEGDRVVYEGIVIGIIDSVEGTRSNVKLFSSPQSSITVRIGEADVEAVGQGGGRIKLEAPKSEEIEVGDPVLMPALSLDLIGVVREVSSPDSNAFQTVFFGAPVSLAEIRYVELHRSR